MVGYALERSPASLAKGFKNVKIGKDNEYTVEMDCLC